MKMDKLAKEIFKARFKSKKSSKKARKQNAKFINQLYMTGSDPDMVFTAELPVLENIKINESTIHVTGIMKQWMVDYLYAVIEKMVKNVDTDLLENKKDFILHFNAENDVIEVVLSDNDMNVNIDDGTNNTMIDAADILDTTYQENK